MPIEITEPQEGWKRCPRCEREGFRPPWQGYCYECQRAYESERRAKRKAERIAFERDYERKKYHDQIYWGAITMGLDPESVEYPDPPWWSD